MLRPRIIPCLLLHNRGLVKTHQFTDPTYVGDPLNAVRIFNEKEVDELLILDIDATVQDLEPNYELIAQVAAECRMPLAYGGGIKSVEQVERIIALGVEKVAISSAAILSPELVTKAASKVGSQSIAVVVDVRSNRGSYRVFTNNGKVQVPQNPVELAKLFTDAGAGEFVINNIERDGMGNGYDLALVAMIREACNLPITILGGAGSLDDISSLFNKYPIIGAAAGSLFVFKGKYRAVLINYPNRTTKDSLFQQFH